MTLDGGDGLSDTSSSGTIRPNRAIDASIVVRLHFAEAMAILLFNALDGKQQSSVKQGLNRLMAYFMLAFECQRPQSRVPRPA